jgi:RNA polymerase sigma-70 factor (ECF subfamily)
MDRRPKDPLRGHEVAALLVRAQAGDVAAFERLIGMYQGKVFSFARAFTADAEEASDLAQEALIKVYRSIGGFRFQSSFSTWLFRIVKNTFLDHVKSRRTRESQVEQRLDDTHASELQQEEGDDAESQLMRQQEHRALWAAIRKVPEAYRTVLVMADMQGLSYEEIAVVVEAPLGTVKSRLKRGRDALREALLAEQARGGDGGGGGGGGGGPGAR